MNAIHYYVVALPTRMQTLMYIVLTAT